MATPQAVLQELEALFNNLLLTRITTYSESGLIFSLVCYRCTKPRLIIVTAAALALLAYDTIIKLGDEVCLFIHTVMFYSSESILDHANLEVRDPVYVRPTRRADQDDDQFTVVASQDSIHLG